MEGPVLARCQPKPGAERGINCRAAVQTCREAQSRDNEPPRTTKSREEHCNGHGLWAESQSSLAAATSPSSFSFSFFFFCCTSHLPVFKTANNTEEGTSAGRYLGTDWPSLCQSDSQMSKMAAPRPALLPPSMCGQQADQELNKQAKQRTDRPTDRPTPTEPPTPTPILQSNTAARSPLAFHPYNTRHGRRKGEEEPGRVGKAEPCTRRPRPRLTSQARRHRAPYSAAPTPPPAGDGASPWSEASSSAQD